jgi:nucleoside phosphorylase
MGNVLSADAAASLNISFGSIRLALLVGILGAVPYGPVGQEIILGDVIVSEVLVQLDFGRQYPTRYKRKDTMLDGPGKPNEEILGLLPHWRSQVMAQQLHAKMMQHSYI